MGDSVNSAARSLRAPDAAKPHFATKLFNFAKPSIAWLVLAQLSQRLSKSNFNRGAIAQALPNHFTNCAFRHPWMREIGSDAAFPF
jgi:hypothetical protein